MEHQDLHPLLSGPPHDPDGAAAAPKAPVAMTDLAAAVERDLDVLLAEAPQDWLDGEPQVRREEVLQNIDTYSHQAYFIRSQEYDEFIRTLKGERE